MATTAFTSFLPEVMPQVAGCSDILAINAVRNAAIEFCSGTMYWQETQDPVTLSSTDFPYDLEAPTGARVIQPLSIVDDKGNVLTPKSIDWLDNEWPNWRGNTSQMPLVYYQPNPNQIVVVPALDSAVTMTLTLRVAYSPTRTATGIEEWVYQNYLEAIAAGARSRLMAMAGQPWTNPTQADLDRKFFNNAMTDATIEANKAYDRGGMQVQLRRYG